MAGHQFVLGGNPVAARDTVYSVLESQGFKVTPLDDWSAKAERGSKGASIALGALAGKSGRYVMLDIVCQTTPDSNLAVNLTQAASGMSGGLIGLNQAKKVYAEIYSSVGATFQNAGVLIADSTI